MTAEPIAARTAVRSSCCRGSSTAALDGSRARRRRGARCALASRAGGSSRNSNGCTPPCVPDGPSDISPRPGFDRLDRDARRHRTLEPPVARAVTVRAAPSRVAAAAGLAVLAVLLWFTPLPQARQQQLLDARDAAGNRRRAARHRLCASDTTAAEMQELLDDIGGRDRGGPERTRPLQRAARRASATGASATPAARRALPPTRACASRDPRSRSCRHESSRSSCVARSAARRVRDRRAREVAPPSRAAAAANPASRSANRQRWPRGLTGAPNQRYLQRRYGPVAVRRSRPDPARARARLAPRRRLADPIARRVLRGSHRSRRPRRRGRHRDARIATRASISRSA